jgi:hypothetical protein
LLTLRGEAGPTYPKDEEERRRQSARSTILDGGRKPKTTHLDQA